ncbi:MAG: flagellar biosynthetic protein FliR [Spirochaetes bacterium]|nr:flagellar biosynthetic protein FliR [Spirochaetota bacterium]
MYAFVYSFQAFLLIYIRMHSMFMTAPFFSSAIIPFRTKAALAFFITLVIFPVVTADGYTVSANMAQYGLMVLREVAIGVYLGFLSSIVFAAFQLSGQYFAVQIGFGINEVLDPMSQVSVPIIGQLKNFIGILVFLYIKGDHFLLSAIYKSYKLAPAFNVVNGSGDLVRYMVHSFSGMFVIALKIALPIVATIFLVTVSEGVLAKAAPQMNIMMLGFPFKIIIAFSLLAILSPMIIRIMHVALERSFTFLSKVILYWPV